MRPKLCTEMVEEGEIEAEIPPNRINFQEFVEKLGEEEEDRISGLPDCLLHEILSRLPSTREAIITGTLSKRWKHVWTWVHTLSFTSGLDFYRIPQYPDFVSFVDKTLTQCRQLNLKKFQVISGYDIRFESQVNNWIRFAIIRNVEELILRISDRESQAEVLVDQIFFLSSCFTHLTVQGCKLNPTGAISWINLTSLFISFVKLDQDLIENILSGSPLLETLVLNGCYGYRRLDLSASKSVNNLVFLGFFDPDNVLGANDIEINAPNILSLTIQGYLSLWKLLLVDVSSLVEAHLDFTYMCRSRTTRAKAEAEEEMLKGLILNLRHVNELKIGDLCSKAVSRLEAKGFVFPSNIKLTYLVENRNGEVLLLDDGPDDNEVT